jgi:hypothetical protein
MTTFSKLVRVFENEFLVVVDKPAGWLSVPSRDPKLRAFESSQGKKSVTFSCARFIERSCDHKFVESRWPWVLSEEIDSE